MAIGLSTCHHPQGWDAHAAALIFDGDGLFDIGREDQGQFACHHICRAACSVGHDQFDGLGWPCCVALGERQGGT